MRAKGACENELFSGALNEAEFVLLIAPSDPNDVNTHSAVKIDENAGNLVYNAMHILRVSQLSPLVASVGTRFAI